MALERGGSFAERGGWWVVAQVGVFAAAFVLGLAGPRWPSGVAFAVVGVVAAAGGLTLIVGGMGSLGPALTPFPRPRADTAVRDSGVYRLVRHPIYGGLIVVAVGWGLFARPLGLAGAAALGLFFELKSRREEGWLVEHDPSYEGYRARVRWRFVPGIR